jgi:hypothetical protein
MLTIASCTAHGDGRVEAVDLAAFEPPRSAPPNPNPHLVIPPVPHLHGFRLRDRVAARDDEVPFEELEQWATPMPTRDELLELDAARPGARVQCDVHFCVNKKGRVVDVERIWGDEQLAELYIEHVKRWRFAPYEVDSRKTRVCTSRQLLVRFTDGVPEGRRTTEHEKERSPEGRRTAKHKKD